MPRFNETLTSTGYFEIDGKPHQKGAYDPDLNDDSEKVGIYRLANNNAKSYLVIPQIYSAWENNAGVPYASYAALIADINASFFSMSIPVNHDIEVSSGSINGLSTLFLFGHNPDLDSGSAEDIWEGGGVLTYLEAAEIMDIESSSASDSFGGVGANVVLINGLDSDYNEISETVSMNGTTPVQTVNSYLRVQNLIVIVGESGNFQGTSNVGNITATSNVTGFLQCQMDINEGISQNSQYTIPAGKTFYFVQAEFNLSKASGTSPEVEFMGMQRDAGVNPAAAWVRVFDKVISEDNQNELVMKLPFYGPAGEKSDIKVMASTSTNNTDVRVRGYGYLVDNDPV